MHKHRPSDIARSKRVLEAGRTKADELCAAMFTYKIGRFCVQVAEDVIRRHAQDIVSDTSYKAGLELLSCAAPDILVKESDIASSTKYLRSIPTIGSKLMSAWADWSQLRAEEQLEDMVNALNNLVRIIEHGAAILTSSIIDACQVSIVSIDNEFADDKPSGALVEVVASLSRLAWDHRRSLDSFRIQLHKGIDYMTSMLDALAKSSKGLADVHSVVDSLGDALLAPRSWTNMLWAFLSGLEAMGPILRKSLAITDASTIYPNILEDLQAFRSAGSKGISIDMTETQRTEVEAAIPLLHFLSELYANQKLVAEEPTIPGEAWRSIMPSLTSDESVDFVIDWLEQGSVADYIHNRLWAPLRAAIFDHLLNELRIADTMTMQDSAADGADNSTILNLLLNFDTSALANDAGKNLKATDGLPTTEVMRHTQHTLMITHIVAETSRGCIHIGKFQHSHAEATMIDCDLGGLLSALLALYNQMYTVMVMAAMTHFSIFGAGVADIFQDKSCGSASTRIATPSSSSSSISRTVIVAINGLDSALRLLDEHLGHDALTDIDSQKYNLVRSMSFCKQWFSHMRSFLHGAQSELTRIVSRHLQSRATELENSVPRWNALFPPAGNIDWDLVTARLLAHPRRSSVAPLIKATKSIMNDFNTMRSTFTSGASIDSSIMAFLNDCIGNAEGYLLVAAAVNTLVNHARLHNGPANAQEIIDIGAKKPNFDFPDSLKLALQDATVGRTPVGIRIEKRAMAPSDAIPTASKLLKLDPSERRRIKSEAPDGPDPHASAVAGVEGASASSAAPVATASAQVTAPAEAQTKVPVTTGLSRPARAARKRTT